MFVASPSYAIENQNRIRKPNSSWRETPSYAATIKPGKIAAVFLRAPLRWQSTNLLRVAASVDIAGAQVYVLRSHSQRLERGSKVKRNAAQIVGCATGADIKNAVGACGLSGGA